MNFVAPKNFKRGRLIANKYRPIDLVISFSLITTSVVSILIYALSGGINMIVIMIFLIPNFFAALILIPLTFYHNVVQRIFLWILYVTSRNDWKWQGTYHYLNTNQGGDDDGRD